MAHFAEIDQFGKVIRVIVAEQDFIDSGVVGNPRNWVQTSYNNNIRKNFAGIGYIYDKGRDAFIPPKPTREGNFVFDEDKGQWTDPDFKKPEIKE